MGKYIDPPVKYISFSVGLTPINIDTYILLLCSRTLLNRDREYIRNKWEERAQKRKRFTH